MASDKPEESVRMAALCQRLGRLCSAQEVEIWEDEPAIEKLAECRLTLLGKVITTSNINFQAFQETMKRVWRVVLVGFSQREGGLYLAKFHNDKDYQCISQ